jgi:hypothetical protein
MPDRPILPEPTSNQGEGRFRADPAAYLGSLFIGELGDLLGELPEPTRVALMRELSERGPAWAKLPGDWPQLPRRTLRENLDDRRAARRPLPPGVLQQWRVESGRVADQLAQRRRTGAIAERRVAEALRAWATDRDLADPQRLLDPPTRPADRPHRWPGPERDPGRDER